MVTTSPSFRAITLEDAVVLTKGLHVTRLLDRPLLLEETTGRTYPISESAYVSLPLFDLDHSLAATAGDLATALEADQSIVADDLLGLARRLGQLGLLDDISAFTEEHREAVQRQLEDRTTSHVHADQPEWDPVVYRPVRPDT